MDWSSMSSIEQSLKRAWEEEERCDAYDKWKSSKLRAYSTKKIDPQLLKTSFDDTSKE